jgi:ribosomal protein S18 acetylase RimI-like enzyme
LASVINDEIISFYESLIEEKENFGLPLKDLLQATLLITERIEGRISGIAGISEGKSFFIVVKKEYQNQKMGQRLLTKVISLAKEKRYHYITLNVFASNSIAVHIYQKFGFSIAFTNIMDSRKNCFMILPLDGLGVTYKVLIKIIYKSSLASIIHRLLRIRALVIKNVR